MPVKMAPDGNEKKELTICKLMRDWLEELLCSRCACSVLETGGVWQQLRGWLVNSTEYCIP